MILLLTLYFLQGVPIGLASSIPMLLTARGASFADQALFSLAAWPYSLKLLWAPLVDALHTRHWRLGARKSWIVPCQLLTGALMIAMSAHTDHLLGDELPGGRPPDTLGLLLSFLALYFLVATQDIAVDGWALTLLRAENVGYASTANTVGQGCGVMAAFGGFMALNSAEVTNTYVRVPLGLPTASNGLLSVGDFLTIWGTAFILVTLAVWVFQLEEEPENATTAVKSTMVSTSSATATSSSSSSREGGEGGGSSDTIIPGASDMEGETDSLIIPTRRAWSLSSSSGRKLRRRAQSTSRSSESASEENEAKHASSLESSVNATTTTTSTAASVALTTVNTAASKLTSSSSSSSSHGAAAPKRALSKPKTSASLPSQSSVVVGATTSLAIVSSSSATTPSSSPVLTAIWASYAEFFAVSRLPAILWLAFILVTVKLSFAATDRATSLIMQTRGMPKETLAFLDVASFPLQLAVQVRRRGISSSYRY